MSIFSKSSLWITILLFTWSMSLAVMAQGLDEKPGARVDEAAEPFIESIKEFDPEKAKKLPVQKDPDSAACPNPPCYGDGDNNDS